MSMERSHGLEGSQIIADTALKEPASGFQGWYCIYVINDAVINTGTSTASNVDDLTGLNGITLFAGTQLFGTFTAIQLASGVVQAYKLKSNTESY